MDVYNDDAGAAYATIRNELERYSDLRDRPEIIALTKCEGVDEEIIEMQRASIRSKLPKNHSKTPIRVISSQSGMGLTEVLRGLNLIKNAKKASKTDSKSDKIAPNDIEDAQEEQNSSVGEGISSNEIDSLERVQNGRNPDLPVIKLGPEQLSKAWKVDRIPQTGENPVKFVVTGPKIEKFARRTDLENYASVNRLRDIMKKMGIRAELTSQGAVADSIISIAGKEFTLVEDY